jgi:hypothetical protein
LTDLYETVDRIRATRPTTPRALWLWVNRFTGVRIPTQAVCDGHAAPFTPFARQFLERPSLALWHEPRGSGKSFRAAITAHLVARFNARQSARVLGGSLAQSEQTYRGLTEAILEGSGALGSDGGSLSHLGKKEARYRNGSTISVLAASPTSVRGPHVATLFLDEIDEIDPDIREAAMGMNMAKGGLRASCLMTSTWHRVAGPMAELMERGRTGAFPCYTSCLFEALERCPDERSGPDLQNCHACPLVKWCHADRDSRGGVPKAKRSNGHYTIDAAIQKLTAVSLQAFESDYLCLRPKVSGVWFTMFDEFTHVKENAEYDPRFPVHLTVDSGVHTGAVWFQVKGRWINVFADYFAEGVSAAANARAIIERTRQLCGVARKLRVSTDPAGNARTSIGPSVRSEYEREGLKGYNGLEAWSVGKKADTLQLVEAALMSADGVARLTVHPRCKRLRIAFAEYARARRAKQWMDYPADPQHPHEDLIDPLCGGLHLEFPSGFAPPSATTTRHAGRLH